MHRGCVTLTGCGVTVMTRCTVIKNNRVVNRCIGKGVSPVTDTAILDGRQVVTEFTRHDHIVMTRVAGDRINNSRVMVKLARRKVTWGVANVTIIRGWHVVG